MQNSTNIYGRASEAQGFEVKPVQQSFFEPVQTSLFTEQKPAPMVCEAVIDVHCDMCSEQDSGTPSALNGRGWGLYGSFEFCPYHEDQI